MKNNTAYLFTSESVTEGHPDKVCDQISDALLDEILASEAALQDKGFADENGPANINNVRCAVETMVTQGLCVLAGEIRTQSYIDVHKVVRDVIRDIGYSGYNIGFDADTCGILNHIHDQSPDIAIGVDSSVENKASTDDDLDLIGAGDQGIIFGFACDETDTYMPMPVHLAHRLSERLTSVRKDATLDYLRPDGKTQVTLRYVDGAVHNLDTVVLSTQHSEDVDIENLRADIKKHVIEPVMNQWGVPVSSDTKVLINPTGRFVVGGPAGDTGVTGRKLIVDTYGGAGRHGGGAFSGKDPTKVDRSATYAARWVAKNVVAAGLAHRCEVQLAYAIGVANPVSISVNTFGSSKYAESDIEAAICKCFDLRPAAILRDLDLWRPIYRLTSNYGHFGRELPEFEWEKLNRVEALQSCF